MTLEELARPRKMAMHRRMGKLCIRGGQVGTLGEYPRYAPFVGKFESRLGEVIKPKYKSVK
jgi:hypothetical protein